MKFGAAEEFVRVLDVATGKSRCDLPALHGSRVSSLALNADGNRLAVAGGRKGVIRIRRPPLEDLLKPDGDAKPKEEKLPDWEGVKVYDTATGKEVLSLRAGTAAFVLVAFAPPEKLGLLEEPRPTPGLATADESGAVRLWDGAGKPGRTLHAHQGSPTCLAFSPDGKRLLSAGPNGTVVIHDAASGASVQEYSGPAAPVAAAFSPDGRRVVSAAGSEARVWDVESGKDLTSFRLHAGSVRQGLELAVLSACETGLGAFGGGEGVYGLQRAFHVAGCRNVVASLWKVDDAATEALMALFYANLWEKKLDPAEALRQAQLTMYRHPTAVSLAKSRGVDFS